MTAPRPHHLIALAEVGETGKPFASSPKWRRHQCCSSAIRTRALSTIWILSGFDKWSSPPSHRGKRCTQVSDLFWAKNLRKVLPIPNAREDRVLRDKSHTRPVLQHEPNQIVLHGPEAYAG